MNHTFKRLFLILLVTGVLFPQTSSISGVVIDQSTQQPLVGANVTIEDTELGTATDTDGQFIISAVPPGFYHLKFTMIGYRPYVKMNIRVTNKRNTYLKIELEQQFIKGEAISVTRALYQKEKDAIVSSRTVDFEELRRDPGGALDIQRMMQALPSVVSSADQQNEIIVRGGSPGENLFLMDDIEIANPNHFGIQGTGGGPVNMINNLFIDRVDFFAGAFPAKYYDRISSVMDIHLKEGSRNRHSADLDMSMSGLGVFAEGPLFNGRGSYMTAIRQSFVDLVIKSAGLNAIPHYWNTQTKLVYDLNQRNKLSFNYAHGADAIDIEGEDDAWSRGAENGKSRGDQSIAGLTLKHLWRSDGITRFTLAGTTTDYNYDVFRYLPSGEKEHYYWQNETEWDIQVKGDFVWKYSRSIEFSGGADLKQLGRDYDAWAQPDTVWQYIYRYPGSHDDFVYINPQTWRTEIFPIIRSAPADSVYRDETGVWHYTGQNELGNWQTILIRPDSVVSTYPAWSVLKQDSAPRIGGFFQVKWRPGSGILLNLGLRYGYLDLTGYSWFAPRLGFSYNFTDRTSFNFGFGEHYQAPSMTILTYEPENEKLRSKHARQIVLGLEHYFSEDTRGTVEVYQRLTEDIPVSLAATTIDSADYDRTFVNAGKNRSAGIEFFLQKKLAKDLFGTVSYSHYTSENRDPRFAEDVYYSSDFDFRDVFTLVGGYKIPLRGSRVTPLNQRDILTRLLGKTLGWGADELELSFRYRYVGGRPYTALLYNYNVRRWSAPTGLPRNDQRLRTYQRFDLMILWHISFRRFNMISYINIMNVTDRDNIWDLQRNADGTVADILQFKTFPVGGITLEF